MQRLFTKAADGSVPNGRWYAGDVNALQDAVAAKTDLTQAISLGSIAIGESGLLVVRYGSGEARLTGALRTDGIIRALGGLYAGAFTTTARNAIGSGLAPYGLVILNTTVNRYEWNRGTDSVRDWQPLSTASLIGVYGSIPGASTVVAGTTYFATDISREYISDGSQWILLNPGDIGAGLGYGTAFPTTHLFTGQLFTLEVTNPVQSEQGGKVMWDFIYRDDLDATYPWHFRGGAPIQVEAGGLAWNNAAEAAPPTAGLFSYVMPAIDGVWTFDWYVGGISGTQTGAVTSSMRFMIGATQVMALNSAQGSAGGNQADVTPTENIVAAGTTVQSRFSHNSGAGENGGLGTHGFLLTPMKLAG